MNKEFKNNLKSDWSTTRLFKGLSFKVATVVLFSGLFFSIILGNGIPLTLRLLITLLLVFLVKKFHKGLFLALLFTIFLRNTLHGDVFGIEISGSEVVFMQLSDSIFISLLLYSFSKGTFLRNINDFLNLTIGKLLVVYFILQLIATLASVDFSIAFSELLRLPQFLLLTLIVIDNLRDRKTFELVIHLILIYIVIAFIIYGYKFSIQESYYSDDGIILFLLSFGLSYLAFYEKIDKKILFRNNNWNIIISVVGSIMLLIANSRRFTLSIIILWVLSLVRQKVRPIYLGLSVFLILSIPVLLPESVYERMSKTTKVISNLGSSGFDGLSSEDQYMLMTNRDILWDNGMDVFSKNPLIGVGPAVTNKLMDTEYRYSHGEARVHNFYIQTLADSGFISFVVYLLIISHVLINSYNLSVKREMSVLGKVAFRGIFDVFVVVAVLNYFGARGTYGKLEWLFFGLYASFLILLKNKKISAQRT